MISKLSIRGRSVPLDPLAVLIGLAASVLWAYWPQFRLMAERWTHDPRYSHGYLVPLFALVLLWLRRDRLATAPLQASWWGLPLLLAGVVLRLAGAYFSVQWLEAIALLPCLAGLGLLAAGWPALRWAGPAIGFLGFMVPLPYRVETALTLPLQRIGTLAGTYLLQTLGLPALAEGNIIVVNTMKIGVVEACSGLSMLMVFAALSAAVVLVIHAPRWTKLAILGSAVPIAIVANVARIAITALLYQAAGSKAADVFFHDLAGWFMMPLALGLFWIELRLLAYLVVEVEPPRPMPITLVPRRDPRLVPPATLKR